MSTQPDREDFLAAVRRVDPSDFARMVAATPDELLGAAMRTELRGVILDEVFRRFEWFFETERAGSAEGTVEWRVGRDGGEPDRYAVRIANGKCTVEKELTARAARTTLEIDAVDCLRLVTGGLSQPLLLLGGRLRVAGDENFAIEHGGFFSLPTPDGGSRAADPISDLARIDLTEIVTVVAETPDAVLRGAVRGAFRDVLLEEVFRRFPAFIDPERSRGVNAAFEWRIVDDGRRDHYVVAIEDGRCRSGREVDAEPQAILRLGAPDLLKLVTGNANPYRMILTRRLRFGGDPLLVARLPRLFRIPAAEQ